MIDPCGLNLHPGLFWIKWETLHLQEAGNQAPTKRAIEKGRILPVCPSHFSLRQISGLSKLNSWKKRISLHPGRKPWQICRIPTSIPISERKRNSKSTVHQLKTILSSAWGVLMTGTTAALSVMGEILGSCAMECTIVLPSTTKTASFLSQAKTKLTALIMLSKSQQLLCDGWKQIGLTCFVKKFLSILDS